MWDDYNDDDHWQRKSQWRQRQHIAAMACLSFCPASEPPPPDQLRHQDQLVRSYWLATDADERRDLMAALRRTRTCYLLE